MTANVLITVLNLILLLVLIYFLVFKKSQKLDDSKDWDLKLNQLFNNLFEKITEKNELERDKIQSKLVENFNNNQEKIQKIETNLESFVKQSEEKQKAEFEKQTLNLQTQFEQLKNANLENLQKIQLAVTDKLEKSILNLNQVNKEQLEKIYGANNENFKLLNKTNQERLDQINSDVQKRLDENFARNLKSFDEVTKNLGYIQSTAQKMIDSTKSIDKLNNIFGRTSSQSFGDFGEKYLESLLRENLVEKSWEKQVKVPNSNNKIDFLIQIEDKKIGIDSKFPLTKYQDFLTAETREEKLKKLKEYLKAVLDMARDISQKYLQVGFIDSLFLYLPSDSMYSEVINNQGVMETLQKLKVTPASPATVFPLILIINQYQFKLKVSQNAEQIISGLSSVSKNIGSFRDEFRKLGDKIRQAQTNYDQADRSLIGVEKNILLLENNSVMEVKEVEKVSLLE